MGQGGHLTKIWPRRHHAHLATIVAGITAIVSIAFVLSGHATTTQAAEPAMACNGFAALCDRPFNTVVFAASHNSMAAADLGWVNPYQEQSIPAQLDYGIRMFLIDTHYWTTNKDAEEVVARLPAPQAKAAQAFIDQSGPPQPGVYLCHMACGLGRTPLVQTLTDFRKFLDTHPHEVMGIFLQDAVTPHDTVAAFDAAGLTHYTYTHPTGTPWPTLRQMIESNHRLLVMAEVKGPPPDWYQQGWQLTSDTSYSVTSLSGFNCELNRGKPSNDLFLLNNWIAALTPNVADAAQLNSYGFLLHRARTCEAQRGHIPNFIAVNFAETGDLLAVVNRLNGVGSRPSGAIERPLGKSASFARGYVASPSKTLR